MSYAYSRMDLHIVKCRAYGRLTAADRHELIQFVRTSDVDLLLDFNSIHPTDAARELRILQSMLPRTAVICTDLTEYGYRPLPGRSIQLHPVRYFTDTSEALDWLRSERYEGAPAATV